MRLAVTMDGCVAAAAYRDGHRRRVGDRDQPVRLLVVTFPTRAGAEQGWGGFIADVEEQGERVAQPDRSGEQSTSANAGTVGAMIGPPVDSEYAVDPVGVATITPSARIA